jgi:hypothetical protein
VLSSKNKGEVMKVDHKIQPQGSSQENDQNKSGDLQNKKKVSEAPLPQPKDYEEIEY